MKTYSLTGALALAVLVNGVAAAPSAGDSGTVVRLVGSGEASEAAGSVVKLDADPAPGLPIKLPPVEAPAPTPPDTAPALPKGLEALLPKPEKKIEKKTEQPEENRESARAASESVDARITPNARWAPVVVGAKDRPQDGAAYVSAPGGEFVTYTASRATDWNRVAARATATGSSIIQASSSCEAAGACCPAACDTGCNDACCGVSCDLSCGCFCAPRWSVGVDAIFFSRNDFSSKSPLVTSVGSLSSSVFSASSLDPGAAQGGPRLRLYRYGGVYREPAAECCGASECGSEACGSGCGGQCCGTCYEVPDYELVYFNINDFDSKRTFAANLVLLGSSSFGSFASASVGYSGRLQNFEANAYRAHSCWTKFLYGFRWAQIDEQATIVGQPLVGSPISRTVSATNDYYGGQIGVQHLLYDQGGHLTVNTFLKTGVYANVVNVNAAGISPQSSDTTRAAFIGDFQVQGRYELTSHWAATVGYELFWLTDAASAVDQLAQSALANDTILYHGVSVGLVATY